MYIKQQRGKIGENLASKYLEVNQHKIIDRNFRCKQGEIDIIAYDKIQEELVFFEVKTRSNLKYGMPSESVQKEKQKHILSSANYYTYKNKIKNTPIRFDIIEVFLVNGNYKINHIKNAFDYSNNFHIFP